MGLTGATALTGATGATGATGLTGISAGANPSPVLYSSDINITSTTPVQVGSITVTVPAVGNVIVYRSGGIALRHSQMARQPSLWFNYQIVHRLQQVVQSYRYPVCSHLLPTQQLAATGCHLMP